MMWVIHSWIQNNLMTTTRLRSAPRLHICSGHPHLGIDDLFDVWVSDPLFYPANPPAHWLMCAEVAGNVLVVPIAPSRAGDPRKCRPIGCYVASQHLADQYGKDHDQH